MSFSNFFGDFLHKNFTTCTNDDLVKSKSLCKSKILSFQGHFFTIIYYGIFIN